MATIKRGRPAKAKEEEQPLEPEVNNQIEPENEQKEEKKIQPVVQEVEAKPQPVKPEIRRIEPRAMPHLQPAPAQRHQIGNVYLYNKKIGKGIYMTPSQAALYVKREPQVYEIRKK